MEYIVIIIVSYLLGTIPAAYLIVKLTMGEDIRQKGSRNIGAMNSYEVSGKKWIGITVLLIDLTKGILSVLLAKYISNNDFFGVALASVFAVMGHNFNIFLGFKGGRGLATAAGSSLLINPLFVLHWVIMWILGFFVIKRNVHVGNLVASVFAPVLVFSTPESLFETTTFVLYENSLHLKILSAIICFIILTRHIQPIKELIAQSKDNPI